MRRVGFVALVTVALLASATVVSADNGKGDWGRHSDGPKYTAMKVTNPITGEVSKRLVREKSPNAVLAQHMKALNSCDWKGLMAQYPDQYQLRMPNGAIAKGRAEAAPLFAGFGKGGALCGIQFAEVSRQQVDGTILVTWVATGHNLAGAPLLTPYYGADAYVTDDGLMVSMVSTFDGDALKFGPVPTP
jgi:hypothetical protein